MTSLEIGYRRLLAWYPGDYRREYEEELIGVLLAAAEPGRRRPHWREVADLLMGAVRVRLRHSVGRGSGARWREAAGAAGAVLATLMLITGLPYLVYNAGSAAAGGIHGLADLITVAVPLPGMLMVAAVWAGRRLGPLGHRSVLG
ncbi:hypothetical protein ACGFNU_35160 [Spirillospora sp. NPDC048911]|uniref:hypothetical protein n=1 Tax=Spirillospora sp. NPDC048911 TaxID=3364527 RepID=UPI00371F0F9A